jgi:sn-glycerol 3-phosphate transport system permease protein
MVERAPVLDTICHAILIAGALLVCVPLYFAFVAGSLSIAEVQKVPLPWLPGDQFAANLQAAWAKADFSRTFLNSVVVAVGIAAG